jgi:hypothetical protein
MGITLIFKGKDWGGKSTSTGRRTISLDPEKVLSDKIEQGKVLDSDIQQILKSGDSKLLKKLYDKENKQRKKKLQLEDKLGITDHNVFQGVDDQGFLYKDIPLNKLEE